MTENASFVVGGVSFPLTTGTGNSLLKDADPALYYTLQYFASVLQTYVGARLVADAAPLMLGQNAISQAVQYQLPYDPMQVLLEQPVGKWPLLAIHRETGKDKEQSIAYGRFDGIWKIWYVLPPLTSAQREKLGPILAAVPMVIRNRISNMRDPLYQSGARIWALAGIQEVELLDEAWGSFDIATSNLVFPAWTATLGVIERDMPDPPAARGGQLSGVDVELDDISGGGAPLPVISLQANTPNPTSIATLEAFYRSDQGITLDSTQALIAGWSDLSGHSYTLTPNAPINQPYRFTDPDAGIAPKNRVTVQFDGSAAYLSATDAALAADTGKTLVIAFRLWDTAARSSLILVTDTTANGTLAIEANTASSGGGKLGLYATGSSFDTQFSTDNQWHVAVLRITNSTPGGGITGTVTLQIDDLPAVLTKVSGSGNWMTLGSASALALAGLSSNLSATAAHASIGVAMAFSSKLSDTDAATAVDFCKQWIAGTV